MHPNSYTIFIWRNILYNTYKYMINEIFSTYVLRGGATCVDAYNKVHLLSLKSLNMRQK